MTTKSQKMIKTSILIDLAHGPRVLTELVSGSPYRGVHFGRIVKAVSALKAAGILAELPGGVFQLVSP